MSKILAQTRELPKEPEKRLEILKETRSILAARAKELQLPFSIIITGSAEYGLNSRVHGNLDDVDLYIVVSGELPYDEFVNSVNGFGSTSLFDSWEVPTKTEYEDMLSGKVGLLSIYSVTNGIHSGAHTITRRLLEKAVYEDSLPIFTLVKKKASLFKPNTHSIIGSGFLTDLPCNIKDYDKNPEKMLIREYLFLKLHSDLFPAEQVLLKGVVADKLMQSAILFESSKAEVVSIIKSVWHKFAQIAKAQFPSNDVSFVQKSFVRGERYSAGFIKEINNRYKLAINQTNNV